MGMTLYRKREYNLRHSQVASPLIHPEKILYRVRPGYYLAADDLKLLALHPNSLISRNRKVMIHTLRSPEGCFHYAVWDTGKWYIRTGNNFWHRMTCAMKFWNTHPEGAWTLSFLRIAKSKARLFRRLETRDHSGRSRRPLLRQFHQNQLNQAYAGMVDVIRTERIPPTTPANKSTNPKVNIKPNKVL